MCHMCVCHMLSWHTKVIVGSACDVCKGDLVAWLLEAAAIFGRASLQGIHGMHLCTLRT